jgi:UbiD family decarboxylase
MPVTDTQAVSALAVEVRTWEHLKSVDGGLLDIVDVRCLPESGAYALVLKLRPRAPGQAKLALMAALSGPSTIVKLAIAVDDDIDVSTMRQVMWAIATRVDAANDVHAVPGVRVFALDAVSRLVPSPSGAFRVGAKWFIDATVPMDQPGLERAKFDPALPPNLAGIDLDEFLS